MLLMYNNAFSRLIRGSDSSMAVMIGTEEELVREPSLEYIQDTVWQ
jgi:hypothetical protein